MSHGNELAPNFGVDQHEDLLIAADSAAREEGLMQSLVADRIYQFAAVTAGIFLLVTLL
jgi:hypothetical protein